MVYPIYRDFKRVDKIDILHHKSNKVHQQTNHNILYNRYFNLFQSTVLGRFSKYTPTLHIGKYYYFRIK